MGRLSLAASTLTGTLLLSLLAACPKPVQTQEVWEPVEGAPASRSLFSDEQKAVAAQYQAKAHLTKMRSAFVKDVERVCKVDDDCVLTPMHCCTCASGGQSVAVHKEKLPPVIQRRGVVCQEYNCTQVVSAHRTCEAERAICREGQCVPDIPEGPKNPAVKTEPIPDEPPPAEPIPDVPPSP